MEKWNLYARQDESGRWCDLIMPDEWTQELPEKPPFGPKWFVMKWPLNPHFTGKNSILFMLNNRTSEVKNEN